MANSSRRELDMDVRDILWELVRRWRVILVLVLLGAVLMGGKQYLSDYQAANTPKEQKVEQALEQAKAELNKTEMESVLAAVALSAQIDATCTYMNESPLMNMDPYHEYAVILHYVVTGDDAESIARSYRDYIQSGVMGELVSLVGDEETATQNGFAVKVILSDGSNDTVDVDGVKEELNHFAQQLSGTGSTHTLTCVSEQESEIADLELAALQEEKALALKEDMAILSNLKANMSGDQLNAFLELEKDYFPWGEEAGEEATASDNSSVIEDSVADDTETSVQGAKVQVSINKTKVMVGAVIGLVVAILYIFLSYLLTGRLRRSAELEHLYDLRVLGTVSPKYSGKLCGKVDALFGKLRKRRTHGLDVEQEIGLIVTSLVIDCKKNEITRIYLTSSQKDEQGMLACQQIAEELKKRGIEAVCGDGIAYDSEALYQAAEIGAVVLVEGVWTSYYSEIVREVKICEENHMDILGAVVIGE